MLSESLYKQIFKEQAKAAAATRSSVPSEDDQTAKTKNDIKVEESQDFEAVEEHLSTHNLWGRDTTVQDDLNFELPKLHGSNIDEHFRHLATKQTEGYVALANKLKTSKMPAKPKEWKYAAGWTKYGSEGEATPVEFPDDNVYVFDIETLVEEGNYPTMATAVSDKHW